MRLRTNMPFIFTLWFSMTGATSAIAAGSVPVVCDLSAWHGLNDVSAAQKELAALYAQHLNTRFNPFWAFEARDSSPTGPGDFYISLSIQKRGGSEFYLVAKMLQSGNIIRGRWSVEILEALNSDSVPPDQKIFELVKGDKLEEGIYDNRDEISGRLRAFIPVASGGHFLGLPFRNVQDCFAYIDMNIDVANLSRIHSFKIKGYSASLGIARDIRLKNPQYFVDQANGRRGIRALICELFDDPDPPKQVKLDDLTLLNSFQITGIYAESGPDEFSPVVEGDLPSASIATPPGGEP